MALTAAAVLIFLHSGSASASASSTARETRAGGPSGHAAKPVERRATRTCAGTRSPSSSCSSPAARCSSPPAGRAKRGTSSVALRPQEAVSLALDESLDDLRNEPDLRRAIIAAYARMERALAAGGLPRRPSEAPFEYVERALDELETSAESARTSHGPLRMGKVQPA